MLLDRYGSLLMPSLVRKPSGGALIRSVGGGLGKDTACCCNPIGATMSCSIFNISTSGNTSRTVQDPTLVLLNVGAFTLGNFNPSHGAPPDDCDDNPPSCVDVDGEHELTRPGAACLWEYKFYFCGTLETSVGVSAYSAFFRTNNSGDVWWVAQIALNHDTIIPGLDYTSVYTYEGSPVSISGGGVYLTNGTYSLTQTVASHPTGVEMCYPPGSISLSAS